MVSVVKSPSISNISIYRQEDCKIIITYFSRQSEIKITLFSMVHWTNYDCLLI